MVEASAQCGQLGKTAGTAVWQVGQRHAWTVLPHLGQSALSEGTSIPLRVDAGRVRLRWLKAEAAVPPDDRDSSVFSRIVVGLPSREAFLEDGDVGEPPPPKLQHDEQHGLALATINLDD